MFDVLELWHETKSFPVLASCPLILWRPVFACSLIWVDWWHTWNGVTCQEYPLKQPTWPHQWKLSTKNFVLWKCMGWRLRAYWWSLHLSSPLHDGSWLLKLSQKDLKRVLRGLTRLHDMKSIQITYGQYTVKMPDVRVGWQDSYLRQQSVPSGVWLGLVWSAAEIGIG